MTVLDPLALTLAGATNCTAFASTRVVVGFPLASQVTIRIPKFAVADTLSVRIVIEFPETPDDILRARVTIVFPATSHTLKYPLIA